LSGIARLATLFPAQKSLLRKGSIMIQAKGLTRVLLTGLLAIGASAATSAAAPATAATGRHLDTDRLVRDLRADLATHLRTYADIEHASAAVLSVNLPGRRSTIDVSAGTTTWGGSRPVRTDSVLQIGSNTKAFTAVLLLKLEAERRLSIDDTVGRWLPQYPQWSGVTIRRLLNMTSGIPSYENQPGMLADLAAAPYTNFSSERLVGYAVGAPPTTGYDYSNTNYALAQMIIEKVTGDSYQNQLYRRIIGPLGLRDIYYRPHLYPGRVMDRMPAGYFFWPAVPQMVDYFGRDVSRFTMSWTQGAGGIVATSRDWSRWERAMYSGSLLPARQQAELLSLVSVADGQPIDRTSPADRDGYGLGVQQRTSDVFGTYWWYEGGTLGFRSLHQYFPESGVIVAMGLNSQPGTSNDMILYMAAAVHDTLIAHGLI
jgi:D-alanyl-D-alanine carboxypeptidase